MEDKIKDALKTVRSICMGTPDCRKCEFFGDNGCILRNSPAYWHLKWEMRNEANKQ